MRKTTKSSASSEVSEELKSVAATETGNAQAIAWVMPVHERDGLRSKQNQKWLLTTEIHFAIDHAAHVY
jgi:hypothetical protein